MNKSQQLNLNKYERNLNDFLGNTTQMTLLTWLFINPINKDNLRAKNNILPLSNILCKGKVDQPLPLILYNHYTDSMYIYLAVSGSTTHLLSQIEKFGNNFWIDLEKNPQKYANIYIVPNILVGRWFQLGLIINGQVLEIYINSKLSQSIILQNSLITNQYQNIIHLGPIVGENIKIEGLKGKISKLRFYPTILSIKEINDIYEQGLNQGLVGGWAVKSSEWIDDKAEKYIMPIPDKLKNIGQNIGQNAGELSIDQFQKLGNVIIDSNIFKGAEKGLGKGLNALKKGDIGNRLLYGNSYTQSVPYLTNDQELLSSICNRHNYVPNPLPSRQTIGNDKRQCNNDCDCYSTDKCNISTYTCDSSLKTTLKNPVNINHASCFVSDSFKNDHSAEEVIKQNNICNNFTNQNCPVDVCFAKENECKGTILLSHNDIENKRAAAKRTGSGALKKLNTIPVNSYVCNQLCNNDKTCNNAIYDRNLESCYSNNEQPYCSTENSNITITQII
jgi:hypothetical protein